MSKILSASNSIALSLSTGHHLEQESQSLPSPINGKDKAKRIPTAIISVTDTDLLSLEPKDYNNFGISTGDFNNDLDLFSSYADSVASPIPLNENFGSLTSTTTRPQSTKHRVFDGASRSLSRSTSSSLVASPQLHSTLLPSEDSVEILNKRPLTGKLSSVTIKRNKLKSAAAMRRVNSFGEESAIFSSPSVSVLQMNFDHSNHNNNNNNHNNNSNNNNNPSYDNSSSHRNNNSTNSPSPASSPTGKTARLPIFRPFPGKRLSSNPHYDPREVPATHFFKYSLRASQQQGLLLPPVVASLTNTTNSSTMTSQQSLISETSQTPPPEELLGVQVQPSESLQNLSHVDSEEMVNSPASYEKPVLGGQLLETQSMIREPPQFSPSKYRSKKKPGSSKANQRDQPVDSPTTRRHKQVSLYRPSTGSLQTNPSLLDPLPYQVHGRVLGWKLTSVQRRKELIDVVDMMKERARLTGASSSAVSKSPTFQRRLLTGDLTTSSFNEDFFPNNTPHHQVSQKLSVREVEAWQQFVTRSLKSRQGYKSVKQIRNLMEEKRQTEKLTEIAANRHDLLRHNRSLSRHSKRKQNVLNEKSEESGLFESDSREILRKFDSLTASQPLQQSSSRYLQPPSRQPQIHIPRNTTPVEYVYNFPKSIHKPRDRMDILESVAIRHKLEGRLSREREAQKEALVDSFLSRGGALDTFSDEMRSPLSRGRSKDDGFEALDRELQLLGLNEDGFEDEGSGFAYLEELVHSKGGEAEEEDDYDPGTVDSILEKFGGGGGNGRRVSHHSNYADDLSELSLNQLEDIKHEVVLPPQEIEISLPTEQTEPPLE